MALDAGETFGENYSEAAYWWKRAADAIKARGYKELAIQAEQFAWLDSLLGQAQTDLMDTPPRLSIEMCIRDSHKLGRHAVHADLVHLI